MKRKKILILLPDGVGLRNFAFSSFVETGEKMGWEVIFWNQTRFDLEALGYREIKINAKVPPVTDLYKRARKNIELSEFEKRFEDPVYRNYKFRASSASLKQKLKNFLVFVLTKKYSGENGLRKLRKELKKSVRGSHTYNTCIETLKKEKPDFIFCTNQRPVNAIAALCAAEDLGVPTGTFIFSWDNLPKATMVVEPNNYFVWSDYMKKELLKYYPYIEEKQVQVTGAPQFEPHYKPSFRVSKKEFYETYGLNDKKEYLCFSGDDITTSPHDPIYLMDVAEAVRKLNKSGLKLGVIFRRCPVDFSARFDEVLSEYKDVIVPIEPLWDKQGETWNSILPTKEDLKLQTNIIQHSFMVINVGSSMVFDYIAYNKACAYINYNPTGIKLKKDIHKIYKYVHFRSMPSKKAVLWLSNKEEIICAVLQNKNEVELNLAEAQKWFERINMHPVEKASERIWDKIESLVSAHE